jgi:putative transposase
VLDLSSMPWWPPNKARNIMDRLPKELHAATRRMLRQAWELDDAAKAEKLIRNLARRLDQERPGVAASILEGLDEILTVVRLKPPIELRRSLACTNIAENMMGTIRRVTRNVKRWRNGKMALRWVAAGMIEAAKGFRKLKAHQQLPILRAALIAHQDSQAAKIVAPASRAAKHDIAQRRSEAEVQQASGHPPGEALDGTNGACGRLELKQWERLNGRRQGYGSESN